MKRDYGTAIYELMTFAIVIGVMAAFSLPRPNPVASSSS